MNPHAEQENEDVRDEKISNATISDETVNNNGEPFCGTQVTPLTPLISDEALGEKIRLLNKLQREIFDFVNKWAICQKKKKVLQGLEKPHNSSFRYWKCWYWKIAFARNDQTLSC